VPSRNAPGSPAIRAALTVGFALVATLYLYWGTSSRLLSFGGDNATYLLIARDLSPFGPSSPGAAGYAHQSYYPPLYPLLMAVTGTGRQLWTAHAFTVGLLLAAFVALFVWCRRLGASPLASALLSLGFAAVHGTYMTALEIESEPLYLTLSLVAVAAAEVGSRDVRGWRRFAAPLAVGSATLTRSAGLALLVAFLVFLAIHRPKRAWLDALVASTPTLVWMRLGGNADYGRILVERYRSGGLVALLDTFGHQVAALWADWVALFAARAVGLVEAVVIGLTLLGAVGSLQRLRRGRLDALYLGAYLTLIVIWPFPGEMARFLVVVLPIVLVHAACATRAGLDRFVAPRVGRWARVGLWAVFGSVLVPQLWLTAVRFLEGDTPELAGLRRSALWYDTDRETAEKTLRFASRLEDALARLTVRTPADACVFSVKPSLVGLLGNRRSLFTPSADVDDAKFRGEIERAGCRDFFLIGASTQSAAPFYPRDRFDPPLEAVDVTRIKDDDANAQVVSILARLPIPPASSP
jgi:hypothetical protein